jgi:hypothetical protein
VPVSPFYSVPIWEGGADAAVDATAAREDGECNGAGSIRDGQSTKLLPGSGSEQDADGQADSALSTGNRDLQSLG